MDFHHEHFSKLRPYLYHLTARSNILHIQKDLNLKPANTLFTEAGELNLRRKVRRGSCLIKIGDREVKIRDQDPLHAGKILFLEGWNLDDLVFHLNCHVFFWPGRAGGPIPSGQNHFERYRAEDAVVLRVKTEDLFSANASNRPLFSKYNSGAGRCIMGKGSPRGPRTFLPIDQFKLSPAKVIEVTFKASVALPLSVEASESANGPWKRIDLFRV